jgi:hypothetical protein
MEKRGRICRQREPETASFFTGKTIDFQPAYRGAFDLPSPPVFVFARKALILRANPVWSGEQLIID